MTASVRRIQDLRLTDAAVVGGKGAIFGELTHAGLPVPGGFVITKEAYLGALERQGVREKVQTLVQEAVSATDADYLRLSSQAQYLIEDVGMPEDLRRQITDAYRELGDNVPVAVRTSMIDGATATADMPGLNTAFVNVLGIDDVIASVVDCWASMYSQRVLAQRHAEHSADEPAVAVVVQRMVQSERSGLVFTADPLTGDTDRVIVEAVYGQAGPIIEGRVEPDTYVVSKSALTVLNVRRGHQEFKTMTGPGGEDLEVPLTDGEGAGQVVSEDEIVELVRMAVAAESRYLRPQVIEFAFTDGVFALVEARPIRGVSHATGEPRPAELPGSAVELARGFAGAPGRVTGRVRILHSPASADLVRPGDILVVPAASPAWVPAIRRAAALVTDHGGITSHAALLARELGIPCVVGARTATSYLYEGETVCVDGDTGEVKSAHGLVGAGRAVVRPPLAAPPRPGVGDTLGTRIYVNLTVPDQAHKAAALGADGVGLLRAEFIAVEALRGEHPDRMLQRRASGEFVDSMTQALLRVATIFGSNPVVYRSIDFRSDELLELTDGARFERPEANPLLGYRGTYRSVSEGELFNLELEALSNVYDITPNLRLMLPFVRTKSDLRQALLQIKSHPRAWKLPVWITAEVPSAAYWVAEYARMGVEGVSISSSELTQLMLGVDRNNERCAAVFDESEDSVVDAIGRIVQACRAAGIESSFCGDAPARHPDFAEKLVRMGITSVSLDLSAFESVRRNIAAAERRIVLEAARD